MIYNVIVIGAGAAGATAAALLSAKKLKVALVDKVDHDQELPPRPDWLLQPVLDILDEIKVVYHDCVGPPFTGAVFYPADLSKSAETTEKKPPAFRVDYTQLVRQINCRAVEMGVERIVGRAPKSIETAEDNVEITLDTGSCLKGSFLIMATGAGIANEVGTETCSNWVAQACLEVGSAKTDDKMHWVLGMSQPRLLACWWFVEKTAMVNLHAQGSAEQVEGRLRNLLSNLAEQKLLPGGASANEVSIRLRPAPAESALTIDSHIAKRSLLIGDAGGFIPAMSRGGIYSAMWSASLAADVLVSAVCSEHAQDELRGFSNLWRSTMAEYLRPPHTDARFLLPMVFSNQQIAQRMAAAFWRGENI